MTHFPRCDVTKHVQTRMWGNEEKFVFFLYFISIYTYQTNVNVQNDQKVNFAQQVTFNTSALGLLMMKWAAVHLGLQIERSVVYCGSGCWCLQMCKRVDRRFV